MSLYRYTLCRRAVYEEYYIVDADSLDEAQKKCLEGEGSFDDSEFLEWLDTNFEQYQKPEIIDPFCVMMTSYKGDNS